MKLKIIVYYHNMAVLIKFCPTIDDLLPLNSFKIHKLALNYRRIKFRENELRMFHISDAAVSFLE